MRVDCHTVALLRRIFGFEVQKKETAIRSNATTAHEQQYSMRIMWIARVI